MVTLLKRIPTQKSLYFQRKCQILEQILESSKNIIRFKKKIQSSRKKCQDTKKKKSDASGKPYTKSWKTDFEIFITLHRGQKKEYSKNKLSQKLDSMPWYGVPKIKAAKSQF